MNEKNKGNMQTTTNEGKNDLTKQIIKSKTDNEKKKEIKTMVDRRRNKDGLN